MKVEMWIGLLTMYIPFVISISLSSNINKLSEVMNNENI